MDDKQPDDSFNVSVALFVFLFFGIILLLLTILGQMGEGYSPYLMSFAIMLPGLFYLYSYLRNSFKADYDNQSTSHNIKRVIFLAIWFSLLLTILMIIIYEGPPPKERIAGPEVILPIFLIWTLMLFVSIYFPVSLKMGDRNKNIYAVSMVMIIYSMFFFFGLIYELGVSNERCLGIGMVLLLLGLILLAISMRKQSDLQRSPPSIE